MRRGRPEARNPYRRGKVIYVDSAATGSNNGTSPTNAYTTLVAALADANVGTYQIRVAGAATTGKTYVPGAARTSTFSPPDGSHLVGGFNSLTSARAQSADPSTYLTILSGAIEGDNCYHVVAWGSSVSCVVEGFVVSGGAATGAGTNAVGSGIAASGASGPTLSNITIQDCEASAGGAVYIYNSAVNMINCRVTNCTNAGSGNGGGVCIINASGTTTPKSHLRNVEIDNCTVGGTSHAGGLFVYGASPEITNCYIHDNEAAQRGGGVVTWGYGVEDQTYPVFNHCAITGNTADHYGGGVWNRAHAVFNNCIIANNESNNNNGDYDLGGAGLVDVELPSTLNNCVIFGNVVNTSTFDPSRVGPGAGVCFDDDGTTIITDCIIYGNVSADGTQLGTKIGWDPVTPVVTYTGIEGGYTGTGNVTLEADPFADSTDPIGTDLVWWTADDGLKLPAGSALLTASSTGGEIGAYAD